MKHNFNVTIALVLFFFAAQFMGLLIINQYIDHKKTTEKKEIVMQPLPYGFERPEVKNQSTSFIYITAAVLVGTSFLLILVKFEGASLFKIWLYTGILRIVSYILLFLSEDYSSLAIFAIIDLLAGYLILRFKLTMKWVWKLWFFATVWVTLSIAFAAFINNIAAAVLALIVAILKFYKPNILIQNFSEIFVYGGLAAIFVPMFNLFAAFMLLIVISIYDFIAVFKTKHMIKLAEFQSGSKVFAGLSIHYEREPKKANDANSKSKPHKSIAVLGGGDIAFTLIFAGTVMKEIMLKETFFIGFLKTLIIPVIVTLALFILLMKGRRNKFYPAMPVLSLGCLLGYLAVWLI